MIKAVIFDMYETLITHYQTPLYFSHAMAKDMNIPVSDFLAYWRPSASLRTRGELSLEDILKMIVQENNLDETIIPEIVKKRKETKIDCFKHLHPEIIPMLEELKKRGIKIGLITNCFSEEAEVIKKSILYPYFDVPILSYDVHLEKPDPAIFYLCLNQLGVKEEECLYIGDGGSHELEASTNLGMKAKQCIWYFDLPDHPGKINSQFEQISSPLDVLNELNQVEIFK